jgi:hypothetical protein
VLTDVSEEHVASIFRVEEKEENPQEKNQLHILTLVLRLRISSFFFHPEDEGDTLLETSVNTISTWHHIPEDCFLHNMVMQ